MSAALRPPSPTARVGALPAVVLVLSLVLSAALPPRARAQTPPAPTPSPAPAPAPTPDPAPSPAPLDLAAAGRAGDKAVAWLRRTQNADGSWGRHAAVRGLATSEAVIALRAWGRSGAAYYRGVTWLENRALSGVDYRARRILALAPRGNDVSADSGYLLAQLSLGATGGTGWGLASAYGAGVLDTALVLQAYGELGLWRQLPVLRRALLSSLRAERRSDSSWPAVASGSTGDAIVTALVLRAYAAVRSAQPTLGTEGDAVARYLAGAVNTTASPLRRAHAALALLRWTPCSTGGDAWLRSLLTSQSQTGGWQGDDPYVSAVVLQALAARLGRDALILQLAVSIPDQELRAALNKALGPHRDRGDAITWGDMLRVTQLNLARVAVRDLRGLEFATNLKSLTLPANSQLDRAPLAGLTGLTPVVAASALAPSGLVASRGTSADHVALHWQPASGAGSYSVFRCITEAAASCGTAVAANLTDPSYLDRRAPAGQTYYYRVKSHVAALTSPFSAAALGSRRGPPTAVVTTPLTATGVGTHKASGVRGVALDGRGRVYATAHRSNNVFRIDLNGTVTRLLGARGAGGRALDGPEAIAVTRTGTVYVAGVDSDNVFRIPARGIPTQLLGPAGVGGHALDAPSDLALDDSGRLLVAGRASDNVFRIAANGAVTRILSSTGDGTHPLDGPAAVVATPDGSVYVAGTLSHNVFRIGADGTVTQVLTRSGDGVHELLEPVDLAVDGGGDVLVLSGKTGHIFRLTPADAVTLVHDPRAAGGPALEAPAALAVAADGHIFVVGRDSDNLVVIPPAGPPRQILGTAGDGTTLLDGPAAVQVDAASNVYVASAGSHAVFRVSTRFHKVLASTDFEALSYVQDPAGLALAGDGRLYVADRRRDRVLTVTPGGALEGSVALSRTPPSPVSASRPIALALDADQNFYAAGASSDNLVAGALWTPTALRQVVATAGDGTQSLSDPTAAVADAVGTVYVAGGASDNVFKVTASGTVSRLIDSGGDGSNGLDHPAALVLHGDGTLYVAGRDSDNVFRITAAGVITQILGSAGVGGHALDAPVALALHSDGVLYVAGRDSDNVFRVPATGAASRVLSASGDGINALDQPVALAVDAAGVLYVAGGASHNVFALPPGGTATQLVGPSGDGITRFHRPVALVSKVRGTLAVATAGKTGATSVSAAVFRLAARAASAATAAPLLPAPAL